MAEPANNLRHLEVSHLKNSLPLLRKEPSDEKKDLVVPGIKNVESDSHTKQSIEQIYTIESSAEYVNSTLDAESSGGSTVNAQGSSGGGDASSEHSTRHGTKTGGMPGSSSERTSGGRSTGTVDAKVASSVSLEPSRNQGSSSRVSELSEAKATTDGSSASVGADARGRSAELVEVNEFSSGLSSDTVVLPASVPRQGHEGVGGGGGSGGDGGGNSGGGGDGSGDSGSGSSDAQTLVAGSSSETPNLAKEEKGGGGGGSGGRGDSDGGKSGEGDSQSMWSVSELSHMSNTGNREAQEEEEEEEVEEELEEELVEEEEEGSEEDTMFEETLHDDEGYYAM